jgi:hypothetical protein
MPDRAREIPAVGELLRSGQAKQRGELKKNRTTRPTGDNRENYGHP